MRSCLMTRSSADGTLATRSGIRSRDTCSEPLRWRALKWSVTALRAIRSSQVRGDAREESYRSNDLKAFMKTSEVTSSAASRVATRKRMQRKTALWCSRNQVPKSSGSAKGAGAGATRGAGSDTLSSVCIALVYGDSATDLTHARRACPHRHRLVAQSLLLDVGRRGQALADVAHKIHDAIRVTPLVVVP